MTRKKRLHVRLGSPMFRNEDQDKSYELFMKDLGKIKILSRDEEIVVGARAQAGDDEAAWQLVMSNMSFYVAIARNYSVWNGTPVCDLINSAVLDLFRAAKKYNPLTGRFISFSMYHAVASMQRYTVQNNVRCPVPLPTYIYIELTKCKKVAEAFLAKNGREPTREELIYEANIAKASADAYLVDTAKHISLDGTSKSKRQEASTFGLYDTTHSCDPSQVDDVISRERKELVERMLDSLSDSRRTAIVGKFIADKSTAQIAEETGRGTKAINMQIARTLECLKEEFSDDRESASL